MSLQGIFSKKSNVTILNTDFYNSTLSSRDLALRVDLSDSYLNNVTFRNVKKTGQDPIIYIMRSGNTTFKNCSIFNFTGNVIQVQYSKAHFIDTLFLSK